MNLSSEEIEGLAKEVRKSIQAGTYPNWSEAIDQFLSNEKFKNLTLQSKLLLRGMIYGHLDHEMKTRLQVERENVRRKVRVIGVKHRGSDRTNWLQRREDLNDEIHGS